MNWRQQDQDQTELARTRTNRISIYTCCIASARILFIMRPLWKHFCHHEYFFTTCGHELLLTLLLKLTKHTLTVEGKYVAHIVDGRANSMSS